MSTEDAECLFCRVSAGEIPAETVFEDDEVVAFRDIDPQAPTHILVIPREHVSSVDDLDDDHGTLAGKLILTARDLAREEGLSEDGYRLVLNTGSSAGQSVFHIHLHLLGGRRMSWPPG